MNTELIILTQKPLTMQLCLHTVPGGQPSAVVTHTEPGPCTQPIVTHCTGGPCTPAIVTHTVQAVPALSHCYSHCTGGPCTQLWLLTLYRQSLHSAIVTLYRRSRPSAVVTHTVQTVPALSHCYSSCLISLDLRAFPEVYSIYPQRVAGRSKE